MEAFEKWWKKQEVSKYNPGAWGAYEEGWRAALEWALSTRGMNHFETAPANCVQTSVIEQELKEN